MLSFEIDKNSEISNEAINRFINTINRFGLNQHSVLIFKDSKICYERYWAPYDKDTLHRIYSATKSFVSIAIGLLEGKGKLSLDDKIVDYFPDKLPQNVPYELSIQTIRDMLKMSTCLGSMDWFQEGVTDRTAFYFSQRVTRPTGTLFEYDSTGSYVLGALVERITGKSLLDYLREKVLNEIGGFENAQMLVTPDGTAWGDSALICTPRAFAKFAQLVMDEGEYNGKQLIPKEYIKQATSKQIDTDLTGVYSCNQFGYGYQFWKTERNGFAFKGLGGQSAICVPEKNFLFVCTGDNQLNPEGHSIMFRAVFEELVDPLYNDVYIEDRKEIPNGRGEKYSPFMAKINGVKYKCQDNPMGISEFTLNFNDEGGIFRYKNAQGDKELKFGLRKNEYTLFPEYGYSDYYGNVHEASDFRYKCAVSGGWVEEQKFQLHVQTIDRYFGRLCITFGFRDENTVGVCMKKHAEHFYDKYEGVLCACRDK